MTDLDDDKIQEFIDLCQVMLIRAYCDYSKFAVASVLVTECGKTFTGKNLAEDMSHHLTIY